MKPLLIMSALLATGLPAPRVWSQTATRDIILKTFQAERPHAETPAKAAPKRAGKSIVGVTLWRMRPATNADSGAVMFRGLEHPEDPNDTREWTAERVSLDSPLSAGQFVRLSVESARKGYLYIIDRDIFSDGSTGQPRLIFPTLRLRGGDNQVEPGRTVEIPDAQDRVPVFTLKKTRADQVSVSLTVIVAPQPIGEIRPSRDPQKLTNQQVAIWEKRWGSKTQRVENSASLGKTYTAAEQAASKPDPRPLGPNDPLPQTLIEAKSSPGLPMLISIPIKMQ